MRFLIMPIKPEDCVKLTPEETELVQKLESKIDAQLRAEFTHYGLTVRFVTGCPCSYRVINRIKTDYSAVGWEVNEEPLSTGTDPRGLDRLMTPGVTLAFKKAASGGCYFDR